MESLELRPFRMLIEHGIDDEAARSLSNKYPFYRFSLERIEEQTISLRSRRSAAISSGCSENPSRKFGRFLRAFERPDSRQGRLTSSDVSTLPLQGNETATKLTNAVFASRTAARIQLAPEQQQSLAPRSRVWVGTCRQYRRNSRVIDDCWAVVVGRNLSRGGRDAPRILCLRTEPTSMLLAYQ